jgi:hypothetical protein
MKPVRWKNWPELLNRIIVCSLIEAATEYFAKCPKLGNCKNQSLFLKNYRPDFLS